jgi:antitoxin ChpS
MVAIPKAILESLGLRPNHKVGLSLEHGRLVIDPAPAPSYTLAELMAQCDLEATQTQEDQVWLTEPPTGKEEI